MNSCPEWTGLSGAYVLDALTDCERDDFEWHLEWCPPCECEVEEFRAVLVRLAECLACQPDPGLRKRVLTGIEE
ncbi:zf-HC2 domain-containing protein [Nocardia blacklockiae]|uniref:zf-HC2 domain-containing protein n=1 Tax=Nocardia blacklockiae TaxID=480036 RepID=UPI001894D9B6|nr:zf-HC2 domain-containing protein [Nocardia blacklockiae]MBF6170938.1 zf-HC2 domain-containing protein [Nocardia blacklockiae]